MALQRFQQSTEAKFNFSILTSLKQVLFVFRFIYMQITKNIKQALTRKVFFYTKKQSIKQNLLLNLQT